MGDDVFHTYSTYACGVESLTGIYSFLDMLPYGRQEDFEDSPLGIRKSQPMGRDSTLLSQLECDHHPPPFITRRQTMETIQTGQTLPMPAQPQKEHQWLQKLVGEWSYETEAMMGPDQPPAKSTGAETVRSLGGLWILAEGEGEMPICGSATTLMTLGHDPQKQRL